MTYNTGQLIQPSEYNGFANDYAGSVNSWWAAGSSNVGWGQTSLNTVSTGNAVYAASWDDLVNATNAGANHTGTTITNRTAPSVGTLVAIFPNLSNDIISVYNNRGNAAASGSTNASWTGTASVTSPTGTGNDNWTMTWTSTVTFGSSNQARYFFNAGGLIKIQMGKSSTGMTKDTYWNNLVSSVGTIYISGGIGASQRINGTTYTGVTVLGSSGSYTSNTSAGWYYLLANGSTQIYQKTQTSVPYTGDTITVTASISGSTLTITTVWYSPGLTNQADNAVSGGTATNSPFSSFGSAPAVVVNTIYPSSTYLTNTWGTNSIAESVSVITSPGPAPTIAEFLVIGGGGGGGSQSGGGGGGMVYRNNLTLPTSGQLFPVVVGAGGVASVGSPTTATYGGPPGTITVYIGAATAGSQGSTTSVDADGTIVSAYGGGAGGTVNTDTSALIGSAGGPPIYDGSTSLPGAVGSGGTAYYASSSVGTSYRGGANQGAGAGGGGAGSAGSASITPNVQVGGNGYEYWSGYGFAAGGGAGGYSSLSGNPFPSSGTYGGSSSNSWYGGRAGILAGDRSSGVYNGGYQDAQSALPNTGSGGGGACYGEVIYGQGAGTLGGNGGSGTVVIRYPGAVSVLGYSGTWTTSISGGFVYHLLQTSGSFYPLGTPVLSVDYVVVGGGGSGGRGNGNEGGGGGGAGGMVQGSGVLITTGRLYPVVVGLGGKAYPGPGGGSYNTQAYGGDSSFAGVTATGGGYGGGYTIYGERKDGGSGASGGGGNGAGEAHGGGAGTPPQGNDGGIGYHHSGGGGGGGAGGAGSGGNPGIGGVGLAADVNGVVYATGGNGGQYYGVVPGTDGTPNTGNGGNGGGGSNDIIVGNGGNGGSGVVVIRYLGASSQINYTGSYTTQIIGSYVVHTFTSSGTLTMSASPSFIPSGTAVTTNNSNVVSSTVQTSSDTRPVYTPLSPSTNFYADTVNIPGCDSDGSGPRSAPGHILCNKSLNVIPWAPMLTSYYAQSVYGANYFTSPYDMVFTNRLETQLDSVLCPALGLNYSNIRSISSSLTINVVADVSEASTFGYWAVDISGTPSIDRLLSGTMVPLLTLGMSQTDRQRNLSGSFTLPVPPVGTAYILAMGDNSGTNNIRWTISN